MDRMDGDRANERRQTTGRRAVLGAAVQIGRAHV